VYVFGSNSNQNGVAPTVTLGSVVIDLPHAFLTVAREVKEGRFKPRVIALGGESDVVTLVMNPQLEARVPAATRAAVDSMRKAIDAGAFRVPTAPE